jgi:hypothetical protein
MKTTNEELSELADIVMGIHSLALSKKGDSEQAEEEREMVRALAALTLKLLRKVEDGAKCSPMQ